MDYRKMALDFQKRYNALLNDKGLDYDVTTLMLQKQVTELEQQVLESYKAGYMKAVEILINDRVDQYHRYSGKHLLDHKPEGLK